jgi:hypothetical protein
MIGFGGPQRLSELVEELATRDLETRRAYLADLAKTDESAERMVKDELKRLWSARDRNAGN